MARNMLKGGLAFLTQKLQAHGSEPVTYGRGGDRVEVLAVFGSKLLKLSDGMGGIRIEWTDMDFLIANDASFVFAGCPITPKRDDVIWVSVPGGVEEFQVFPFGPTEPPWRWSDPHRSMYRIHTKHISREQFWG